MVRITFMSVSSFKVSMHGMVKLIYEQTAYLCGEIPLEMELNKNIGALIRQLRTTCEMIQSELAAKACITWLNLSDIEYGKGPFQSKSLKESPKSST